jgi:hypothetical protein
MGYNGMLFSEHALVGIVVGNKMGLVPVKVISGVPDGSSSISDGCFNLTYQGTNGDITQKKQKSKTNGDITKKKPMRITQKNQWGHHPEKHLRQHELSFFAALPHVAI